MFGWVTGVEAVDHGLDDGQVFVEAVLAFVLGLDMDGHLQPAVETQHIVVQIQHAGEVDQLLALHDVSQ